jgi:glycosyltransferase involved in cell wall biosynthesis
VRICMLLSNGFSPDPRVAVEAAALQAAGHEVTVFAWDRTGELPGHDDYHGVNIVRCGIKSAYSKGPLQIFQFREFWREAIRFLEKNAPEIIHCHDLDTLWPGVKFGRKYKVPVIFDAHESYPDMVAHLFPKPVTWLIGKLESHLVPKTVAVITVGELLADHFRVLRAPRVVVVGNYKKITAAEPVPAEQPPPLKLIYVGGLNRDRRLAPMIQALAGNNLFQFIIVGDGAEKPKLEKLASGAANITFTGFLPLERARCLMEQCHLVYYGIDPSYRNNQYSAPNALFLALAVGRPLITTDVGEIAQIVKRRDCGSVLKTLQPEMILATLGDYLEGDFRRQKSRHGFEAAVWEYTWEKAEQKLLGLYQTLELRGTE